MTAEPRLLSHKAAAAHCGISLMQLRKHGPAPVRVGRLRYYDRVALDRWIEELGGAVAADQDHPE